MSRQSRLRAGALRPAPDRPGPHRRRPLGPLARPLTALLLSAIEAAGRLRGPRSRTSSTSSTGHRKVCFLVHDAFGVGGIARTVLDLAEYLARDHEVEIVSLHRTRERPARAIDPRVEFTALLDESTARGSPTGRITERLRRLLGARTSWIFSEDDPFFDRQSLWLDLELLRRLHHLEHGVLVSTIPGLNVAAARFARRGVVKVGQEHQSSTRRTALMPRIRTHYPKLDALTVLTSGDEERYREWLAGARTRIVRIPNALAEKPTAYADLDSKRVTAAGRYAPQKGFDLLIAAFEKVARRHPDWQLRVYGNGRRYGSLQRQVREASLQDHVLLMGWTDRLNAELARSSIFALSSRWEGFGLVITEAMAVGLPVVSFDCPHGPGSIITDGVDGTLVPPKDVDALAEAIVDLIEHPDKRRAYGAAARKTAAAFDMDSVGRAWLQMFDELLGTVPATATRRGKRTRRKRGSRRCPAPAQGA